jgi:hypothetical protein
LTRFSTQSDGRSSVTLFPAWTCLRLTRNCAARQPARRKTREIGGKIAGACSAQVDKNKEIGGSRQPARLPSRFRTFGLSRSACFLPGRGSRNGERGEHAENPRIWHENHSVLNQKFSNLSTDIPYFVCRAARPTTGSIRRAPGPSHRRLLTGSFRVPSSPQGVFWHYRRRLAILLLDDGNELEQRIARLTERSLPCPFA